MTILVPVPLPLRLLAVCRPTKVCLTLLNGDAEDNVVTYAWHECIGDAGRDEITVSARERARIPLYLPPLTRFIAISATKPECLNVRIDAVQSVLVRHGLTALWNNIAHDLRHGVGRNALRRRWQEVHDLGQQLWYGRGNATTRQHVDLWMRDNAVQARTSVQPAEPVAVVRLPQQPEAVEGLTGAHLVLLADSDRLTAHGLAHLQAARASHPNARLFYGDCLSEDSAGNVVGMALKPGWNALFARDSAYLGGTVLCDAGLLKATCAAHPNERDPVRLVQLMCETLADDEIVHVAQVTHISRATIARSPQTLQYSGDLLVSVVIPTRNGCAMLQKAVEAVRMARYQNTELIIIDNGSDDPATLDYLQHLQAEGAARVIVDDGPFNFSRLMNAGFAAGRGALLVSLNNDVEMIDPGWLDELVAVASLPKVGIVGCKLLYPNGRIQHAGLLTTDTPVHWYRMAVPNIAGPCNILQYRHYAAAVTGAVVMVTRAAWQAAGPLDETAFPVSCNDIDLCFRVRNCGFKVAYTPFAVLIHHESVSRGYDLSREKLRRAERERAIFRERWKDDVGNRQVLSPHYVPAEWPYLRFSPSLLRHTFVRRGQGTSEWVGG